MAKGTHKNVYAKVEYKQASLSDWMVQQEQLDANLRAEKLEREKHKEEQAEKQRKKEQELRDRLLKIPQNYDTSSVSLNGLQAKIIQEAVNRKGEIYLAYKSGNLSDEEKVKLDIENQNLDNLPANLKIGTNKFTEKINNYNEGVRTGKLHRNSDFEKKVLNGYDNYIGTIDKNGNPLFGFQDLDGDGEMGLLSWENITENNDGWNFVPKIDFDKQIDALKVGTEEIQRVKGFKTTTIKKFNDEVVKKVAEGLVYESDGSITNSAKSRLLDLGINPNEATEVEKQALVDYAINRIKTSKDTSDKEIYDHSAATARMRLSYDKSSKDTKVSFGEPVKPSKNIWGKLHNELSANVKSVPIVGKVILDVIPYTTEDRENIFIDEGENAPINELTGLPIEVKEYSNVKVENYTYNREGNMVITGSSEIGKMTQGSSIIENIDSGETRTVTTNKKKVKFVLSTDSETRVLSMLGLSQNEAKKIANYTDGEEEEEEEETQINGVGARYN